jgi:hypothetical protein
MPAGTHGVGDACVCTSMLVIWQAQLAHRAADHNIKRVVCEQAVAQRWGCMAGRGVHGCVVCIWGVGDGAAMVQHGACCVHCLSPRAQVHIRSWHAGQRCAFQAFQ